MPQFRQVSILGAAVVCSLVIGCGGPATPPSVTTADELEDTAQIQAAGEAERTQLKKKSHNPDDDD